jgi:hypothetical protein
VPRSSTPFLGRKHPLLPGRSVLSGNVQLSAELDIFLGFLFCRIGSRVREQDTAADLTMLTQLTTTLPPEDLPTGDRHDVRDDQGP